MQIKGTICKLRVPHNKLMENAHIFVKESASTSFPDTYDCDHKHEAAIVWCQNN